MSSRIGDVRQYVGAAFGRLTEFRHARLAPTSVAIAAVVLLAFAPSALAAEAGAIRGTVTSASSNGYHTNLRTGLLGVGAPGSDAASVHGAGGQSYAGG
jgi:hypothetical protein